MDRKQVGNVATLRTQCLTVAWFVLLVSIKTAERGNLFGKLSRTIGFRNSVVVDC